MSVMPGEWPDLPPGGPATLANVKVQLDIKPDDHRSDTQLDQVIAAVNVQVRSWPVAEKASGADQWPPDIQLGAIMLSARLFRRKNSPAGVEAFNSQGAVYVARNDPDIAQLLKLGSWTGPQVG